MLGRSTTLAKPNELEKSWHIIDAEGVPLGRLAAEAATILMGKHRPEYTPHVDTGDFVIVTNGTKVGLTGQKATQRYRTHFTGYTGGLRAEPFGKLRERRPEKLIEGAIKRMLPKNRLGRQMLSKLKVYPGAEHPHQAQQPAPVKI
ncbi:MAG: 50S ribosomal protein L13 [Planctomycetota bacterium]